MNHDRTLTVPYGTERDAQRSPRFRGASFASDSSLRGNASGEISTTNADFHRQVIRIRTWLLALQKGYTP